MRLGFPSSLNRGAFLSKTLLKVGIKTKRRSYRFCADGRKQSKTHQNGNDDLKYRRRVCLYDAYRVQLTSQLATLSFLNVLVWTFEGSVDANRSVRFR